MVRPRSIGGLLRALIRQRVERLRARGLWPRPTFVVTLAILPVVLALLWPTPVPEPLPEICRMGPELGWSMAPAPPDALASLENASRIYGSANWESGDPAEETTALFVVLARPDAADALRSVLVHATELEGQIYAACGLARLDEPEGRLTLRRIADAHRLVRMQGGCSSYLYPMDALLTHFGDWRYLEAAGHDPSRMDEFESIVVSQHNPPISPSSIPR